MPTINKTYKTRLIKGVAVFAAAVIVILCGAGLFMTRKGLDIIYPYVLATRSEGIETGDAQIGEYFALNKDIEGAGAIILAVDLGVEGSFKLASDYFSFLSRFTDISSVSYYTANSRVKGISTAAVKGDHSEFSKYCQTQKKGKVMPDQYFQFLEKVYSVNAKQTPDKKIPITGFRGHSNLKDIINSLTTDLLSSPMGFAGEHTETINARTPEEYRDLFIRHEAALREALGDKFSMYYDTLDYVVSGYIEEAYAVENLMKYSPAEENGAVFIIAPLYLCNSDSVFIKLVEENYGKTVVTDTVYYNCTTLVEQEEIEVNDGAFPLFVKGVRIAEAGQLKGFRDYYRKISHTDTPRIMGDAGVKTFFIVSGSGPVTYKGDTEGNNTAGTVIVAPGQ